MRHGTLYLAQSTLVDDHALLVGFVCCITLVHSEKVHISTRRSCDKLRTSLCTIAGNLDHLTSLQSLDLKVRALRLSGALWQYIDLVNILSPQLFNHHTRFTPQLCLIGRPDSDKASNFGDTHVENYCGSSRNIHRFLLQSGDCIP